MIGLIVRLLLTPLSVILVQSKTDNRTKILIAGVLTFFLPLIGLIYSLLLPNEKLPKNQEADQPVSSDKYDPAKLKDPSEPVEEDIVIPNELKE